jgi:serine/threonine protein kinase
MTTVFAARESASGRACAVKVVRDDWDDPPTAMKLLQREARAGLTVRNPHLVRVTHAHVIRPPYFLVMELLPGESLRRRLRREYRLSVAEAVWVVRQTAEALAALHRAGFLHGDLKPDNVQRVDDGTVVLLDLGFAHRPGENAAFLRAGYVLGTADYLAPELCDDDPKADIGSDVFSLGVTFFEMLTGQLPYSAGTLSQTFRRHRFDAPAPLRRLRPEAPSGIAGLVERMLAPRPGDRPRAAAVVQQLVRHEIAALSRRRPA